MVVKVVESQPEQVTEWTPFSSRVDERPTCFSQDGLNIFVPSGDVIHIYSVRTAQLVAILSGHTSKVNGVCVCPWKPESHVLSWSIDGTIRVWNTKSFENVDTYKFEQEVIRVICDKSMQGGSATNRTVVVMLGPQVETDAAEVDFDKVAEYMKSDAEKQRSIRQKKGVQGSRNYGKDVKGFPCKIIQGTLRAGDTKLSLLQNLFEVSGIYGKFMLVSPCAKYIVVAANKSPLYVYQRGNENLNRFPLQHFTTALTITDDYVAVGDETGVITLWYVLNSKVLNAHEEPHVSRKHWHANPVAALQPIGESYLVSGAAEGVLCLWNINTNDMQTIPRFGSAIKQLSVSEDGHWVLASMGDNSLRLFDAHTQRKDKEIQAIDCINAEQSDQKVSRALVSLPSNCRGLLANTVAVTGGQNRVQFFSPHKAGTPIHSVAISNTNYVVGRGKHGNGWMVEKMAMGCDGRTMATLEKRVSAEMVKLDKNGQRWALKFWRWSDTKNHFMNETIAYSVHTNTVTSLVAHPDRPDTFFTSSDDATFKRWTGRGANGVHAGEPDVVREQENAADTADTNKKLQDVNKSAGWKCSAVGSWREQRCCTVAAFDDLVAVAHHGCVSVWRIGDDDEAPEELAVVRIRDGHVIGCSFAVVGDRILLMVGSKISVSAYDLASLRCVGQFAHSEDLKLFRSCSNAGPEGEPLILIGKGAKKATGTSAIKFVSAMKLRVYKLGWDVEGQILKVETLCNAPLLTQCQDADFLPVPDQNNAFDLFALSNKGALMRLPINSMACSSAGIPEAPVETAADENASVNEEKSVFQKTFGGAKQDAEMANANSTNVPKRKELHLRQISTQAGGDHLIAQDGTAAHLAPAPAVHFRDTLNRLAQKAEREDTQQDAQLTEADNRKRQMMDEDVEMAIVGAGEECEDDGAIISEDLLKKLCAGTN